MRPTTSRLYLSVLTALLLPVLPAHAALITYSDSASFNAATFGLTSIGFEGQAPAAGYKDFGTSAGYQVSGVQFVGNLTSSAYGLRIVDSGASAPYNNFNSGASLESPAYDRASNATFLPFIRVTLPANIGAFAVDLMTVSPNTLTYQVALQGSTFNVPTLLRPNRAFFGVTSDTAIPFIDFTVAGTTYNGGTFGLLDNFQFGYETPEPGTFLLIGGGLVVLGMLRKPLRSSIAA